MLATLVYILCALTALTAALLLFRAYLRVRAAVVFWSGLCFTGLAVCNVVLVLDKLVYTEIDLLPIRLWITLISLALLLFGLIYSNE